MENNTPQGCTHNCETCGMAGSCGASQPSKFETTKNTKIDKIIAVVSGKGGVGKSSVTCLLASQLQKQGKRVAILDADITGPSIPKAFGITKRPTASEEGIDPVVSKNGIKMISLNLLLDEPDTPVAWRGPMLGGVIRQFFEEVNWGDIDVMLIDMPPGTSDVFLTIMQMIPVDGIVSVSAPQELVHMIVGKAVKLANEMNVEVIGLVENMAYFICDECNKKHYIFGEPQAENLAKKYDIASFATLPIDTQLAQYIDKGEVEDYTVEDRALFPVLEKICEDKK